MNRLVLFFMLYALLESSLNELSCQIVSGPMNGYASMQEIGIWLQMENSDVVAIKYWKKGESENTFLTSPRIPDEDNFFIVKFSLSALDPGTVYNYIVLVNGREIIQEFLPEFQTLPLWQHDGVAPDFSFLTGSCMYINEPQFEPEGPPTGMDYQILKHMAAEKAEFMVWLGDNTYFRDMDIDSRYGIFHRYGHTRAVKELQPLLATSHHYAIWDDHDYGPNDSDYTFEGKYTALEAFKAYWMNPNYIFPDGGGVTSKFRWNDCEFYLMDNRWYRTPPQNQSPVILGEKQIQWLIDALKTSRASIKFICVGGQFLSDATIFENHANYSIERDLLLDALEDNNIENIVFLSGDRHHSELTKYMTKQGNIYYEVTSSPLTAKAYSHENEENSFRYENTLIGVRNYAVINVVGSMKDRHIEVSFKDVNGHVLKSSVLRFNDN